MMMTRYLAVTGALRGGRQDRWFSLPESRRTAHSARFGRHTLVMGDTMGIVPIGEGRGAVRARPEPASENERPRSRTWQFRNKLLSFLM